jgi:hypothetical protein
MKKTAPKSGPFATTNDIDEFCYFLFLRYAANPNTPNAVPIRMRDVGSGIWDPDSRKFIS